jgi:hypothetical protein
MIYRLKLLDFESFLLNDECRDVFKSYLLYMEKDPKRLPPFEEQDI